MAMSFPGAILTKDSLALLSTQKTELGTIQLRVLSLNQSRFKELNLMEKELLKLCVQAFILCASLMKENFIHGGAGRMDDLDILNTKATTICIKKVYQSWSKLWLTKVIDISSSYYHNMALASSK